MRPPQQIPNTGVPHPFFMNGKVSRVVEDAQARQWWTLASYTRPDVVGHVELLAFAAATSMATTASRQSCDLRGGLKVVARL